MAYAECVSKVGKPMTIKSAPLDTADDADTFVDPAFWAFKEAGGRIDSNNRSLKWSSFKLTLKTPGKTSVV